MSRPQRASFGAALLLAVLSFSSVSEASTSCKNDANKDVEWYLIYKLPKMAKTKENTREPNKGEEYVYVDANTPSSAAYWTLSPKSIFNDGNALANTLAPLYVKDKPKDLAFAVYNDQIPSSKDLNRTSNGHTKGFFVFDEQTGFWVVHSVPRFPELLHQGNYVFPESGRENGQIILCITFPVSQLEIIATHLRLQYPNIYDSYAPTEMLKTHPSLSLLLKKEFIRTAPWVLTAPLKSINKTPFISFAKHGRFDKDVYSQLLASSLETSLFASTWRNGPGGKLPPDCDGFTVTNVDRTKLAFGRGGGQAFNFSTTEDHSKWAISMEPAKRYVCIGTLNRMESQLRRGGETLCFRNPTVHKLMLRSVASVDDCPDN